MIQYVDLVEDTICAPITATGYAGVAVIRVSGSRALEIIQKICPFLPQKPESHKVYFGNLVTAKSQENIDQVLVSYFQKGSSFTGDEVLEISSHGSPLIVNVITNELLDLGCRNAERGEFSFRAFYNGKIDLVQAESIQSLIVSQSGQSSKESLKQLDGDLSKIFNKLEDDTILAISHLEATIDFTEEDIDPNDNKAVLIRVKDVLNTNEKLINSYNIGKNLLSGYKVLLAGATNVGKSSLFNQLFQKEKAIVTDISGTTRDLISGDTFLGNLAVEFTDSAGIRESDNLVESIGIRKTLEQMKESDLILFILDAGQEIDFKSFSDFPLEKCLFIFNKMDLVNNKDSFLNLISEKFRQNEIMFSEEQIYFVSAKSGLGLDELKAGIPRVLSKDKVDLGDGVVTQARHFNHLCKLQEALERAQELLEKGDSPDLISLELQNGLMEIQSLLGKNYDDQILDKIFSEFCIGK